jgi:PPM family protein phosphatase
MTQLRMAALSERGERQSNEDTVCHGSGVNGSYAVLADGAGGHSRGREASQLAAQALQRVLIDPGVAFSPSNLTQMVRLAHAELVNNQNSDRPAGRMHTTLVALWIEPTERHVLWTHVGDSRLYRVRRGRAELLTQDDSVVQQLVLAGVITAAQSRQHPHKNQLLAALGTDGDVEPHTVVRPVALSDGDAFLLCSDGWWDAFEPEDLAITLGRALAPADWLADMRARIAALAVPRQDNYSAIAVWLGDPREVTQTRPDDTVPGALSTR